MTLWILCCLSWLEPQPVTVEQLSGPPVVGVLQELSPDGFKLEVGGKTETLPLANLLEARWPAAAKPAAPPGDVSPPIVEVTLQDGTTAVVGDVAVKANKTTITSPELGNFTLSRSQLRTVRLGPADPKLLDAWQKLVAKENAKDVLVIRKGETLDFLAGVIGDIDPTTVKFLIDGDEVPVKRERIYGLIYPEGKSAARNSVQVTTASGTQLQAKSVAFQNETWQITLVSGSEIKLSAGGVAGIDFSAGKVRYLSALTPRDVQYTPFIDDVWEYQRDRGGSDGKPIQLDGQKYSRGLSIHSKTVLKYRLNGEFRRFLAVAGIDDLADPTQLNGDLILVISGDGRELFKSRIKNSDPARKLELDLTDVRDLEILVDFGEDLDIADWLDLADAKVLK